MNSAILSFLESLKNFRANSIEGHTSKQLSFVQRNGDFNMLNSIKTKALIALSVIATVITLSSNAYANDEMEEKIIGKFLSEDARTNEKGEPSVDEYRLKAAYMHYILSTSKWSGENRKSARICVVGGTRFSRFGHKMEQLSNMMKPAGYNWTVEYGAGVSDVKWKCDALFVGFMYSRGELSDYINAARRVSDERPIITVGDDKYFDFDGGMVSLEAKEEDMKVHVYLNLDEAKEAKIAINDVLIDVAKKINGNVVSKNNIKTPRNNLSGGKKYVGALFGKSES